jgi:hypothetical protein
LAQVIALILSNHPRTVQFWDIPIRPSQPFEVAEPTAGQPASE